MNRTLPTVAFAALLLGAAFGLWIFGADDLFAQAAKLNISEVPPTNIVLAACILVAVLLGWLRRDRQFD